LRGNAQKYEAKARILALKKEQRAAMRRAFVSGSIKQEFRESSRHPKDRTLGERVSAAAQRRLGAIILRD
jgi:hypothetical protein